MNEMNQRFISFLFVLIDSLGTDERQFFLLLASFLIENTPFVSNILTNFANKKTQ